MNSMVLWYDLKKQGATNESMAENPVLRDLSGNGHDATCYNFAWSGMSGIGGYFFNSIHSGAADYYDYTLSIDKAILHITRIKLNAFWLFSKIVKVGDSVNYKIKISGLDSLRAAYPGNSFVVMNTSGNSSFSTRYTKDGEYELNTTVQEGDYLNCGLGVFALNANNIEFPIDCDITIEQLPLYPHALVSDGVDDYCLVEGLPLLDKAYGYTVIAKRKWLDEDNEGNSSLITKALSASGANGAFMFECKHQNATQKITRSFGGVLILDNFYTDDITYQTSNSYNSTSIQQSSHIDTNKMAMFRFSTNTNEYYGKFALYSLLLFNRDLTPEEIEWVKTNLIETEQ